MEFDEVAKKKRGLTVEVRRNDVDQALRVLKKMMQNEGVLRDMRKKEFYEKPSEKKRRRKAEARRRMLKQRAQQEW